MTGIQVQCDVCDEWTPVPPGWVRLVVLVVVVAAGKLSRDEVGGRDFYEFPCSGCRMVRRKHAPEDAFRLLVLAGVIPEKIEVPAEVLERDTAPERPLTFDDLLDLQLAMAGTDYLVRERRRGRGFTDEDELAWHVAMRRGDFLSSAAAFYGPDGFEPGALS